MGCGGVRVRWCEDGSGGVRVRWCEDGMWRCEVEG